MNSQLHSRVEQFLYAMAEACGAQARMSGFPDKLSRLSSGAGPTNRSCAREGLTVALILLHGRPSLLIVATALRK
ncbi:hypothetical protein [Pseudomonas sp. Pseu.R1]|uniref:hypothetical protein n=1 Tax=Pseudomonas sp. Pseu.R1 TaxID=3379818 RepID=UPI003B9635C7